MTLWTGQSRTNGLAPATHPRLTGVEVLRARAPQPPVKAASKLVKAGTSSLSQNKNIFLASLNWRMRSLRGFSSASANSATPVHSSDFRSAVSTQFDQFRLISTEKKFRALPRQFLPVGTSLQEFRLFAPFSGSNLNFGSPPGHICHSSFFKWYSSRRNTPGSK